MYEVITFNSKISHQKSPLIHVDLKELGFVPKRAYWVPNMMRGEIRAEHAHKELSQIYICIQGEINVSLDDGFSATSYFLDSPQIGLRIGYGIWRRIEVLSNNSSLLVFADELYDENEYIRDYQAFRVWKKQQVFE